MIDNNEFDIKTNPNLISALGIYIRNKRIAKNIGLREMSEMLNISPSYLSNLELGKHSMMNPMLLKHIATILQIDHLTLFKMIGYTDKDKKELRLEIIEKLAQEVDEKGINDIIQNILHMNKDQIKLVREYINLISKT